MKQKPELKIWQIFFHFADEESSARDFFSNSVLKLRKSSWFSSTFALPTGSHCDVSMFYDDCEKNNEEMCDAKKRDANKCDDSKVFTSDEMSIPNDVKRKFSVPNLNSLVRFGRGETQLKKVGNLSHSFIVCENWLQILHAFCSNKFLKSLIYSNEIKGSNELIMCQWTLRLYVDEMVLHHSQIVASLLNGWRGRN
jgi:hypothetical protein